MLLLTSCTISFDPDEGGRGMKQFGQGPVPSELHTVYPELCPGTLPAHGPALHAGSQVFESLIAQCNRRSLWVFEFSIGR